MRTAISVVVCLLLLTSAALADSINNRLGFTGKLGFTVPIKDSTIYGETFEIDPGVAFGGGLIYGFGNNFAFEFDVSRSTNMDVKIAGSTQGEAQSTDISLGLQYRFMQDKQMVPYVGAGVDFIKGDIEDATLDWTTGGHVNCGLDYFLSKGIALTADFRLVIADDSDIKMNDVVVGSYDPMSFIGTFGIRLILPEKWY